MFELIILHITQDRRLFWHSSNPITVDPLQLFRIPETPFPWRVNEPLLPNLHHFNSH